MTPASAADLLAVIRRKAKVWLASRKKEGEVDEDALEEALTAMNAFLEDVEERLKRGGDPATMKTGIGIDGLGELPLGTLVESFSDALQTIEDEHMREVPAESLEFLPSHDDILEKLGRMRKLVRARGNIDDAKVLRFVEAMNRGGE